MDGWHAGKLSRYTNTEAVSAREHDGLRHAGPSDEPSTREEDAVGVDVEQPRLASFPEHAERERPPRDDEHRAVPEKAPPVRHECVNLQPADRLGEHRGEDEQEPFPIPERSGAQGFEAAGFGGAHRTRRPPSVRPRR